MTDGKATDVPNYKKTLNLPKTRFAMKANLVQREPKFQKRWAGMDLYARLRESRKGKPRFVLHDGPPYANGSIHLGHLLNKVLKDLVVRTRNMAGLDAPFVPGWDCHGLPIEHKVLKDLGDKAQGMVAPQIRGRCRQDAEKFVKLQSKQMLRLGTIADYADPYLTMAPRFEEATLEVFAKLVERGLVYRALRPVHWSIANQTALAEAELEYEDREDDSIFTLFEIVDNAALPTSLEGDRAQPIHLMIWTTTPWTLPANRAVAISASAEYGLFRFSKEGRTGQAIVATALKEAVFDRNGFDAVLVGRCTGGMLESADLRYQHPFLDLEGIVVPADYVTLEDGTGLVHTAPGHGADDFQTGKKFGLETACPVKGDGTYNDTVPDWLQGMSVWDANPKVVERLRESGHLFHHERFVHSYPHDWRSKTPTIFRATEQWFVAVDDEKLSMRKLALQAAETGVRFYPPSGRNRMSGMLESRPDWCISRQRTWGLPIPAFFGPEEGQVLLTPASVRAVASRIGSEGSDIWFKDGENSGAGLLSGYDPAADPDAPDWLKSGGISVEQLRPGKDIFDVWFESGSSWFAVADRRGLGVPVDLYLEGSDQHRGWFQLSLLTALGATGAPPFKEILTHGFMVDRQGKKMSKSLGNTLDVDELMRDFGADICRWWVCSLNTDNDIKADLELLKIAGEEYRKVRNTVRFLLSNLGGYEGNGDYAWSEADAHSVDAWAMEELAKLSERVRAAYESYEFRRVHEAIFNFCNDTMSAVYLSAVKDRLYCDAPDTPRRRRTQATIYTIADTLTRLLAPILVHTADEAMLALRGDNPDKPETDACIHMETYSSLPEVPVGPAWGSAMELRDRVLKELELARSAERVSNPLDAGVEAELPPVILDKLSPYEGELADLCGVSRFSLKAGEQEAIRIVSLADEPRCDRSWKRDGTVARRSDGGMLTERDAEAVGVA